MKDNYVGCIRLTSFYNEQRKISPLKHMIITDEYLNFLGDKFQNTVCKHERNWSFDEWCTEYVGLIFWGSNMKN